MTSFACRDIILGHTLPGKAIARTYRVLSVFVDAEYDTAQVNTIIEDSTKKKGLCTSGASESL